MPTSLSGYDIDEAYVSLLCYPPANECTGSLQTIQDGAGNATPLQIDSGTVNINGTFTVGGSAIDGTVTSVAMTVPSFLSVSGSPITTSGTLAVALAGNLPLANGGTNASLTALANGLVYSTSSALAILSSADNGLLVTNGSGVPSIGTALPSGVTATTQSPLTNNTTVATTAYCDSAVAAAIQGISPKDSCQCATTAALAANTYSNGTSGVGATLTANSNAALTIDGYTVAVNDRVLVKNEATASHNGIYTVTATGSGSAAYVLTRASDSNTAADLETAFSFIENGTTNGATGWLNSNTGTITIGTTSLTYTQFSGAGTYTAGSGLTLSGSQFSISSGAVTNAMLAGSIAASKLVGTDIATVGTITMGAWNGTAISVSYGGTGDTSFTAYGLIAGGTTSTGALQNAGTGTSGQIYVSGGSSSLGTWTTPTTTGAASTVVSTDSNSDITCNNTLCAAGTVTVTTNAGTCSAKYKTNNFTNSSSAAMTITLGTSSPTPVDGQTMIVRVYDHAATAESITWDNIENSSLTAPTMSNGSTTLPLTTGWQYNGATSKWRFAGQF